MNPEKWYFKNSSIMIAFIAVGPLALPLVWFNPRYSAKSKILITVTSAIITYFMATWTIKAFNALMGQLEQYGKIGF